MYNDNVTSNTIPKILSIKPSPFHSKGFGFFIKDIINDQPIN